MRGFVICHLLFVIGMSLRRVHWAISSSQYVWTLFTPPLIAHLHATLAEVQVTFSVLIVLQTFLSPFQGYLVDVFGPRILLSIGAIFTGLSWVLAAGARTTFELYLTYGILGGIGTGIIYVGVVGLMARIRRTIGSLAA